MADPPHPLALSVSYSHLFRGVRLTGVWSEVALPLRASEVQLSFSDGIELAAELLEGSAPDSLALSVPGYETATGHAVAAALWPIAEIATDEPADRLTLGLGQRIS